jgi:ketosteroid isomerase-like protein
MTEATIRPIVEAFYNASTRRDLALAMSLVAEDVDWLVQGPVDVFPFLGQRRGREALLEGYREMARKLEVTGYHVETLLVDGDRAAAMVRLTAIVRATGKVMSVRTTQFSRFQDGKLIEMRGVLDSFDMVEQTLGRALDVLSQDAAVAAA